MLHLVLTPSILLTNPTASATPDIGGAVTSITGFVSSVFTFIQAHPLIMVFAASGLVAIAIAVVRKLIGRY